MAKDMTQVYGQMLTKELVRLRQRHQMALICMADDYTRKAIKERQRLEALVAQINSELADRVSQFSLFV